MCRAAIVRKPLVPPTQPKHHGSIFASEQQFNNWQWPVKSNNVNDTSQPNPVDTTRSAQSKDNRMTLGDFLSPNASDKPTARVVQQNEKDEEEIDDFSFLIKGRDALVVGTGEEEEDGGLVQSQQLHNENSPEEMEEAGPGRIAAHIMCSSSQFPLSSTVIKSESEPDSRSEPAHSRTPEPLSQLAPEEHIASLEVRLSTLEKLVCKLIFILL